MRLDNDELAGLIARCALRDQQALRQLYDLAGPYLNHVAYQILGSEDLSNDALQEAIVQIWNKAGEFRIDLASPVTWMTSITRYRALDRMSREKKHRDQIDSNVAEEEVHSVEGSVSPERDLVEEQRQKLFQSCLESLNDRGRQTIELAYLHGFSREELAAKFDTKVNTIKSWLHRGVERLKRCIEERAQTA